MSAAHSSSSLPVPYGRATKAAASVATVPTTSNLPGQPDVDAQALAAPARSQARQTWDSFRAHKAAFIGFCALLTMILMCAFLPFVLQDPDAIDMQVLGYQAPSAQHLFGTDAIGRDVLSRVVNAGRTSLAIGFAVAIGAALIGAMVGVSSGYFGGKTDGALMWFANVMMSIPAMPLLLTLAVIVANPDSKIGPVVQHTKEWMRISAVLIVLGWMGISRVVRSQVVSLRNQEFVEAALALGGSHKRVMIVHILPNCVSVIAVFTTLAVSGAIIAESALSFLGFGVQPPTATWGNMLAEGRDLITILEYWWAVWIPALFIFITVLSVNFVGDGVRDALDPKTQTK